MRLGTRASLLATTQSGHVADALRAATGQDVELVPITTDGDVLTGPLAQLGGTGVFVAALRDALLRGECDLVVHSMKDLPTAPVPGLRIGAVPARQSARDVLCARDGLSFDDLPRGARVGTGSPRRVAQLRARRPDLRVDGIRGNVDTRLRKVTDGEFDAIVLAEAGLNRIERAGVITDRFPWPASAGQGALAVEIRDDDAGMAAAVAAVDDADARTTALLERAVLHRLEAGCAAPVGIAAQTDADAVRLVAEVYALDGTRSVRAERAVSRADAVEDAPAVAELVVAELLAGGAAALADLGGSAR
ncbi:porphobilinogen deaminase [Microbacterium sp. No. 7]|nr:porphobilinogen deaminase [Microbacterium sp. No. 7]